jgi:C1A family cysteine protease
VNWLEFVGGYAIAQEDRASLASSAVPAVYASAGDIPERVDPRRSKLATEGWLRTENQGSIGSCQGNALSENVEYCYSIATGEIVQLSRMYAYLRSQQFDNIRTDSGSTLSGGTKAVKEGLCLESLAPYPRAYPGWGWLTQAMRDEAKYRLNSLVQIKSSDEVRSFIGSGIGIVQIGIAWNSSMTPDSRGCITNWRSGGGGHSVCFAGYVPDADVGVRSSKGWWALLKNSWGTSWGVQGWAYVDPKAIDQMLTHQWTVMYGRSDMEHPNPRPVPIDFTKRSLFG